MQRVEFVCVLFQRKPDASSEFDAGFLYGSLGSNAGSVDGDDGEQSELFRARKRLLIGYHQARRTRLLEHDRIRIYFFYVSHRLALANGS